MNVRARAGIDIYGTVLRYAEIEQHGSYYRLLKLGSFDFDFDVAEAVLGTDNPEHVEALSNALGEVLADSVATRLHVAVHPPHCYSFFTPLPVDADREQRKQRLLHEASLLTRSAATQPLRLTADPLYTETLEEGPTVEWYHVLALNERMHTRFDLILSPLPPSHFRMTLSMHAVANAIDHLERHTGEAEARAAPYTLAVGWYPTHVEYVVCRRGSWYFSLYAEADDPGDCGYFALLLANHLQLTPADVGRLYVYGSLRALDDFAALQGLFPAPLERFDPVRLVEVDDGRLASGDDLEVYAPCIGVAV